MAVCYTQNCEGSVIKITVHHVYEVSCNSSLYKYRYEPGHR